MYYCSIKWYNVSIHWCYNNSSQLKFLEIFYGNFNWLRVTIVLRIYTFFGFIPPRTNVLCTVALPYLCWRDWTAAITLCSMLKMKDDVIRSNNNNVETTYSSRSLRCSAPSMSPSCSTSLLSSWFWWSVCTLLPPLSMFSKISSVLLLSMLLLLQLLMSSFSISLPCLCVWLGLPPWSKDDWSLKREIWWDKTTVITGSTLLQG